MTSWIGAALAAGLSVADEDFDRFLPAPLREVSQRFWTPLEVVRCAAQWLAEEGIASVVDVGSGAGKFCVAASLAGSASYLGIDHRPHLVESARELARRFGVSDRVRFELGTFGASRLPAAQAYYLFNPFGENVAASDEHFDDAVELSEARYLRDVAAAQAFLDEAPVGTYALVYAGFGGRMPPSYDPVRIDYDLPNVLRLWVKVSRRVAAVTRR